MKGLNHCNTLKVMFFAFAILLISYSSAMAFGRYIPGTLGLGAGTLPPPGFHYVMYNQFYTSDTMLDDNGNDVPIGLDLNVFANVHEFAYIAENKIFGADLGCDIFFPLVSTDIKIDAFGVDENEFGFGDIETNLVLLGWHGPRWDFSMAGGIYIPTGQDGDPSSPGKGYWTFMGTVGGTYYLDEARSWNASILTRWMQNTEDPNTNITVGFNTVAEYGISKTMPINQKTLFTAGIAGYTYAQLSEDSGVGASDNKFFGNGIGPEIRLLYFGPFTMQASLRFLFEYGVENAAEGNNIALTLIGSF